MTSLFFFIFSWFSARGAESPSCPEPNLNFTPFSFQKQVDYHFFRMARIVHFR